MKLLHISDLHIGKRLNEVNLIEDQAHILTQIIDILKEKKPDALLIAGDVYDKAMPSAESVRLFDTFLSGVAAMGTPCFVISGNHDSPERIAFGASIMSENKVYMSKVYEGEVTPITLRDAFGEVDLFMLPFIKPAYVRVYNPDAKIESYQEALEQVVSTMDIKPTKRNVLLMHQFVTAMGTEAERSDSESLSVGGSDNIDFSVFNDFDYVALGHLHKPQRIGRDTVRYSGSPLKYSFSEVHHIKSATLVTLGAKGEVSIELLPLKPLRDLRKIKGSIHALLSPENYRDTNLDDYIHATLTDESEVLDAIGRMRQVYPNIMAIEFENQRTEVINSKTGAENIEDKTDLDLFAEFYTLQNNVPLSSEQLNIIEELLEKIGGHTL